MAKKSHGRPPKGRSKPARRTPPAPRTNAPGAGISEYDNGSVAGAIPVTAATAITAPPVAPPRRSTTRRGGAPARPVLAINYHYLRRDITALGILAPSMIIALIIAYIFLH
ncbi:MAG: hypothetical protein ACRDFX_01250 [Chloroflexota bacterium]